MSKRAMLIFLTCILAFWCWAPAGAQADTIWNEIDDAGDLLGNAQDTGGVPLMAISGAISDPVDIDLFKIYIYDPDNFSASTVGSEIEDTKLWLFDADGMGVMGNDDAPGTWQSIITSASGLMVDNDAGWYYLGVSPYSFPGYPLDADGKEIFWSSAGDDGNQYYVPNSVLPLASWVQYDEGYSGNYTITLTGASPTPIPGSVWLLASGLIGLAALRLRRKSLE